MITNWASIDPRTLTAKFDAYVAGMVVMLSRGLVPGDRAARSIELRTDVLDHQLARIAAARN